ncbi:unnamed protein product [Prorocentrum cordatum]|uniref:Uncharacterized protein n=1 Tax=Prorocentrum cordatum TaxID=2364126 RepID=A0ABN9PH34_9DINO|nr:unnamed protein product [Polarella glacialis]
MHPSPRVAACRAVGLPARPPAPREGERLPSLGRGGALRDSTRARSAAGGAQEARQATAPRRNRNEAAGHPCWDLGEVRSGGGGGGGASIAHRPPHHRQGDHDCIGTSSGEPSTAAQCSAEEAPGPTGSTRPMPTTLSRGARPSPGGASCKGAELRAPCRAKREKDSAPSRRPSGEDGRRRRRRRKRRRRKGRGRRRRSSQGPSAPDPSPTEEEEQQENAKEVSPGIDSK